MSTTKSKPIKKSRTNSLVISDVTTLGNVKVAYIQWVADRIVAEHPDYTLYSYVRMIADAVGLDEKTVYNYQRTGKLTLPDGWKRFPQSQQD